MTAPRLVCALTDAVPMLETPGNAREPQTTPQHKAIDVAQTMLFMFCLVQFARCSVFDRDAERVDGAVVGDHVDVSVARRRRDASDERRDRRAARPQLLPS